MNEDQSFAVVDKFYGALNAGDLSACLALFTKDAVMWRNTSMTAIPAAESLAPLAARAGKLHYDVTRRYVVPDGCIVQFVVRSTKPNVDAIVPHLHRIVLNDGKISRIDIYFDSAQAKAFTAATID